MIKTNKYRIKINYWITIKNKIVKKFSIYEIRVKKL